MQAHSKAVGHLFDKTIHFETPRFQRPYVWEEDDNWRPLWNDIREVAEGLVEHRTKDGGQVSSHFLGAVVSEEKPAPTAGLDRRLLIDGQQRITTLQILVAVLRDIASELCEDGEEPPPFDSLCKNNLYNHDEERHDFKVWPTLHDQEGFEVAMTAGSAEAVREHYDVSGATTHIDGELLPSCYLFFDNQVRSWLEENPEDDDEGEPLDRLIALWNTLVEQLEIVSIELSEEDDGQVIFETLNARGTPLLQSDLVKNYLFYCAERQGLPVEELHDEYWAFFEEDDAEEQFWREKVSQGRRNRPRIELFLYYYLINQTGRAVSMSELFESYKRYYSPDHPENPGPKGQFAQIRNYGEVFYNMHNLPEDSREGVFMRRLDVLGHMTVVPLLLEVFDRHYEQNPEELRSILVDVESFLVRRTICRLSTKNYNRMFGDIVSSLRDEDDFSAEAVRERLLQGEAKTSRWPADEEFRSAWMNTAVYDRLAQKRVRLVLRALECERRGKQTEDVALPDRLTIEHLMPQSWGTSTEWSLPDEKQNDYDAVDRRNNLIHMLGNLTLLTENLNPELSNAGWSTKRDKIGDYSVLKLNNEIAGPNGWDEWDESTIEDRGRKLFESARDIWPHPRSE